MGALEAAGPVLGGRGSRLRSPYLPSLSAVVLIFAAYYIGAKLGLALTFNPNPISVLWPPNAILLAALILAPVRWWPALLAAALPAHLLAELQDGVPLAMVLCWFISNASEGLIGAGIVRWLAPAPRTFDSLPNAAAFVVGAALLAPFLTSFLDAAFVTLIGWGEASYWQLWHSRFLSNVLAVLALVPVIVTCSAGVADWLRPHSRARYAEGLSLLVGLLAVVIFVFDLPAARTGVPPALLYLPLPFLLWAALRFGPSGASAAFALVSLLVIWGAAHGHGPFITSAPADNALSVQLFLSVVGITLMALAAIVQERRAVELSLRRSNDHLVHVSRLAAMGELTASIAHEINQPLGAILSNADAAELLLKQRPVPVEELRHILDDIRKDDIRAGEVMRHMRSLMQKREMAMGPLDLNHAIRDVLELAHADLGRRRVSVATELGQLPLVSGDVVHLQQVLLNLILNGVDAMDELAPAQRRLEIRSTRSAAGGVEVAVADMGSGFAPEQVEQLFQSFYTTKKEGMGLGLAIARSIIETHGGRIWAESRAGGGATFRFHLPANTPKTERQNA
jgi:signal transduction histidine kinase